MWFLWTLYSSRSPPLAEIFYLHNYYYNFVLGCHNYSHTDYTSYSLEDPPGPPAEFSSVIAQNHLQEREFFQILNSVRIPYYGNISITLYLSRGEGWRGLLDKQYCICTTYEFFLEQELYENATVVFNKHFDANALS